jgi:hypothetical protein
MKKRKEKRKEGGQPAVNNVWNEDFRCATGLYRWPYITCIVLLLRFYCDFTAFTSFLLLLFTGYNPFHVWKLANIYLGSK